MFSFKVRESFAGFIDMLKRCLPWIKRLFNHMFRAVWITILGVVTVPADGFESQAHAQELGYSAYHDYRIVTVVEGLERPWSMAFLPGGDMLVTEKPGRLRVVRDGVLLQTPVSGLPEIYATGQAGLLDVVAHPDFSSNRQVYLTYSKPQGGNESTTAVIRGRYIGRGLGLAVDLISRNGGSVRVEDEPGWSKAVVVRLPRAETTEAEEGT